jgi:hypothetical protein
MQPEKDSMTGTLVLGEYPVRKLSPADITQLESMEPALVTAQAENRIPRNNGSDEEWEEYQADFSDELPSNLRILHTPRRGKCADCNRSVHLLWETASPFLKVRICRQCARVRGGSYRKALDIFIARPAGETVECGGLTDADYQ